MPNINFIKKTKISSANDITSNSQLGLIEEFLFQFNSKNSDIFTPTKIIVQNIATENWLKDCIAKTNSICANISFTVLLGPFLEELYKANKPDSQLFDFNKAKFIIYEYICSSDFLDNLEDEFSYIRDFFYNDDVIDFYKAFQLASQLQVIFYEYIYLRTDELLNSKLFSSSEAWQEKIWQVLLVKIGEQKTYLDIYQFFLNSFSFTNLPDSLYIFGLANIYSSQLNILKKLSKYLAIHWYYLSVSDNYYGDLLNNFTKARLQQKTLNIDLFEVSDLYLTEGNQLLANLAQQSREFIELLLNYEIIESEIEDAVISKDTDYSPKSLLDLIQYDIKNILNRIDSKLVLFTNQDCIGNPLAASILPKNNIKVNICHNKMREVQVLFNEICELLIDNPYLTIADIVVLAPKIDDYIPYINAVFANEYISDVNNYQMQIPYVIANGFSNIDSQVIKMLQAILNTPYHMPLGCFLELLNQTEIKNNLNFNQNDLERINIWLQENNIRWGLDATDYKEFGYSDFDINSFKRFLVNLSLGFCIPENLYWQNGKMPVYSVRDILEKESYYVGYDNLENSQLDLCNKLITLIAIIERIRDGLYCNHLQYKDISMKEMISLVEYVKGELITIPDAEIAIDNFIGNMRCNCPNLDLKINLPILNNLINDIFINNSDNVGFTGKLTFASMQSMRNIPFAGIYLLGMNFAEFPRNFNPNRLSIIAKNWALADRNFNLEDKQLFLDIILAAKEFLFISYIGRDENTNREKKPSTVVSLLLETIKNSVMNGEKKLAEITHIHSLHPFYNNKKPNYSVFWSNLSKYINGVDENRYKTIEFNSLISQEQKESLSNINCQKLIKTFLYNNTNLYSLVGLNTYNKPEEVNEYEDFALESRGLYKELYREFTKLDSMDKRLFNSTLSELKNNGTLAQYLCAKGILAYQHLGIYQLDKILQLYLMYNSLKGSQKVNLNYICDKYDIKINDQVWIDFKDDNKNILVICDEFVNIKSNKNYESNKISISYGLQIKSLIFYLLAENAKIYKDDGEIINIADIQLRLIDEKLNMATYQIKLIDNIDSKYLLDEVCKFYIESLTAPVLVHKKSIEDFISPIPLKYKNFSKKEIQNYRLNKAKNAFMNRYQNYDLDALKLDPIFAQNAEEYFITTLESKNTIVRIGELLLNLLFIKVLI